MDLMRSVERDGEKLFCFIEICVNLFPDFSKSTIRSWQKQLGFPSVPCTQKERSFFRSKNGFLNGSFGLISEKDVNRLKTYRDEKFSKYHASPKMQLKYSSPSSTESIAPKIPADVDRSFSATDLPAIQNCPIENTHSSSTMISSPSTEISQTTSTARSAVPQVPIVVSGTDSIIQSVSPSQQLLATAPSFECLETAVNQSIPVPEIISLCDEENTTGGEPAHAGRRRDRYKLLPEEIPEILRQEISELRKFYTAPINSKRDSVQFSESTISKLVERVLCFMFFVKNCKNILPALLSLSLFNSEDIVSDYITYIRNVRKLMPSTISSILSVAINVVKYNYRHDALRLQCCPQILAYRRVQRQVSRQARLYTKRAKEGLTSKSSQQFYFAHILEVLRNLHVKYMETHGPTKARFLHDFVLIATYLRAMPGRSDEIRSLKLFVATEQNPFEPGDFTSDNFIVFDVDNRVFLIQNNHKTAKSQGPVRLDISDDVDLLKYLNLYLKCRPKLMQGRCHDNFFLNAHGNAFASSSSVSKYLGDLFEREVSVRVGTNKLRHAIVTYFHSIDESNDVTVRESLAALMKHSVRYQDTVYNDTTQDEKTRKGRALLRDKFTEGVFGDVRQDLVEADESLSDSDEVELRPQVNDICALLDPISTAENPHFFLAKIARYTPDGQEVHLIHLEPVQDSENLYKVKPGKVWREAASSLVFPLDIVYNSSENAYELRTSAEDIYKCVKGL